MMLVTMKLWSYHRVGYMVLPQEQARSCRESDQSVGGVYLTHTSFKALLFRLLIANPLVHEAVHEAPSYLGKKPH